MLFRKLPLAGVALAIAIFAASPTARAQEADGRAQQLVKDALEEDYLATNFKAAEAKLETALKACGTDKCSKPVLAKVHRARAVVMSAVGQKSDAVEAFKEMLRLDPSLGLDPNYKNEDLEEAYEEAKEASGPAPVVVDRTLAALEEKPWAEQVVGTPVPVFVKLPEGVSATRIVVRYRSTALPKWNEVELTEQRGGYGGYIPCAAVEKEGKVEYFATAFDENLDRVASGGSADKPRVVKLKPAISGRQPALPGGVPPSACPKEQQRLSCEIDDDCPGAKVCRNLQCVDEMEATRPEREAEAKRKKNWVSINFSPDVGLISSTNDACSESGQDDGVLSCFFGDGTQYTGVPQTPSEIQGGFSPGSMRLMVGYDRVLARRMTIGTRLGYVLGGHPERQSDGETFFPFHIEARFAFFFQSDPFGGPGVRPYVFANGGMGETNSKVTTEFIDSASGQAVTLDVYQKGGSFWAGAGGGIQYAASTEVALVLDVGVKQFFPKNSTVIAPTLGFAYGF